ncbi:MAG: YraN family protein [Phycisphaerales bacterium]|nr:YraN family protein [Phycisphaerales bacterium]
MLGGCASLGRRSESVAAEHLRRLGYTVLARNVVTKVGEADLVCRAPDGRTLVVVEVKSRRLSDRARPRAEEQVGPGKRARLARIAEVLSRHGKWGTPGGGVRIDVVAVDWPAAGPPSVRHYAGAVGAGGRV